MNDITIHYMNELPEEYTSKIDDGLIEYETSNNIDVNYQKFALVILDKSENIIGALNAYTAFSEVYIDDIWVDSQHRGNGYGKLLLEKLENEFNNKGFNNINLVSSEFQAPEFYKKCGFEVEFVRKNTKNPQLTKTFFVKYFNNEVQNQGLLES